MKKALISVTGLDATGIIARVATKLYEMNINILDITQTILEHEAGKTPKTGEDFECVKQRNWGFCGVSIYRRSQA